VQRPNGTPVDPEVVTQFICLQQTGSFCLSLSNAASPLIIITTTDLATVDTSTISPQTLLDTLFAEAATLGVDLGSLAHLSDSSADQLAFV
jgi:hypothetical protein